MTKTILALAAAGVLGAATLTGAQAMVPNKHTGTTARGGQVSFMQQQTKLNREKQLLRRDIRLGRTADARRLRREISADQRSISRAKHGGMEQAPAARNMQPTPMPPASGQQNTTNTQPTQNTTPQQNQ